MRGRLAALLIAALAAGCATGPRTRPLEPVLGPAGFCLLCPGIEPDGVRADFWIPGAVRALRARGVEPLPVDYACFLPGYVLGHGTDRPAEKLAAFGRALAAAHEASGCAAPVRLHGIGFSGGTMVLLKAAERGVALERVYFGGSPISLASARLEDALRERRIGRLVNYCSPFDGVVGGVLGCGAFGFLGDGDGRAENRGHLRWHLDPIFQGEEGARVAREIGASGRGLPPHTCLANAEFFAWLRAAETALAEEGRALPAPPRRPSLAGPEAAVVGASAPIAPPRAAQ
jgi:hypothetical protein